MLFIASLAHLTATSLSWKAVAWYRALIIVAGVKNQPHCRPHKTHYLKKSIFFQSRVFSPDLSNHKKSNVGFYNVPQTDIEHWISYFSLPTSRKVLDKSRYKFVYFLPKPPHPHTGRSTTSFKHMHLSAKFTSERGKNIFFYMIKLLSSLLWLC